MNRMACLRLIERCADSLYSVRAEIADAGDTVARELHDPIAKLVECVVPYAVLQASVDQTSVRSRRCTSFCTARRRGRSSSATSSVTRSYVRSRAATQRSRLRSHSSLYAFRLFGLRSEADGHAAVDPDPDPEAGAGE
jgi:hypothetical protein